MTRRRYQLYTTQSITPESARERVCPIRSIQVYNTLAKNGLIQKWRKSIERRGLHLWTCHQKGWQPFLRNRMSCQIECALLLILFEWLYQFLYVLIYNIHWLYFKYRIKIFILTNKMYLFFLLVRTGSFI